MRESRGLLRVVLAAAAGAALVVPSGCNAIIFRNLTKERTGNVSMQFVNNTPYRAVFSFGSYDAWDNTPGQATLQQLRLEGRTTSSSFTVTCRRNATVGTAGFIERIRRLEMDGGANFDADAFDTVVRFSSAPADSSAAGLPTEGTAEGFDALLGVDFSCADLLIFTFEEDPDSPGGFRIDFEVILDVDAAGILGL